MSWLKTEAGFAKRNVL